MFSIFLNFDGNCKEAVTYYSTVFNQEIPIFLTYGEMDTSFDENVQISEKGKSLIASTQLNINGTVVLFSDMPDNFEFVRGNGLALIIAFDTFVEADAVFKQLSDNGMVFVPLTEATSNYSLVADKFGITWQVIVK